MKVIAQILELASPLEPGFHMKIENPPYLALVIEDVQQRGPNGSPLISVAHYGEQNGDLMRDPEMVFEIERQGEEIKMTPTYWRNDYSRHRGVLCRRAAGAMAGYVCPPTRTLRIRKNMGRKPQGPGLCGSVPPHAVIPRGQPETAGAADRLRVPAPTNSQKEKRKMSTQTISPDEYRNLPLDQLQESPTNPRRRFDERALKELAASVTAQGVLQPLLVRPIEDSKYEVVAGARRFRAAKLAALEEVPVRVVELSDAAVRESQLSENLLREDVHPYEEALALSGLLHLEGAQYDVASIAARLGKSPHYVTTRIRLTELESSIAEAFLADQIGVGHALEIAKLPQTQQPKAFDAAFRTIWNGGKDSRVLVPLRDFTAWIEQTILLSLDSVPFDKSDATLVAEAGSCAECPKRTGFNTLLFGEMGKRDQCSDSACYQAKIAAHVAQQIAAKPQLVQISTAYGTRSDNAVLSRNRYVALRLAKTTKAKRPLSPYQKPCKHMSEAIAVDGTERGHTVKICAEPSCSVHAADRHTPNPAQLAKEREQRRKELEKQKLAMTARHRILAEVLKKVGAPLDRADLVLVSSAMLEKMEPSRSETVARRHKMIEGSSREVTYPEVQKGLARLLRQLDESGLSKLIVEIALLGYAEASSPSETDALSAAAKRHRVDVEKVQKTVEAEFAAKQTKQAKKQSPKKRSAKAGTEA